MQIVIIRSNTYSPLDVKYWIDPPFSDLRMSGLKPSGWLSSKLAGIPPRYIISVLGMYWPGCPDFFSSSTFSLILAKEKTKEVNMPWNHQPYFSLRRRLGLVGAKGEISRTRARCLLAGRKKFRRRKRTPVPAMQAIHFSISPSAQWPQYILTLVRIYSELWTIFNEINIKLPLSFLCSPCALYKSYPKQ